jgi:L-ribulokinase
MQIYADVTGMAIQVSASSQTPALGSAMFGAVAAGAAAGGYDDIVEAARHMARLRPEVFRPRPEARTVYQRLYHEYRRLHDYLGRGENDVLKTLKTIRAEAIGSGSEPEPDATLGLEARAADASAVGARGA